ncbi:protein ABHD18 isoform X1 [Prorops nasuta]|uniref:protein ABHD18 isoform X1 n=1 Tax=Prorops nasuta TaxID=863751 RepID=UPI0034CD3913
MLCSIKGVMPEETKTAYFQMILPLNWTSQKVKPVCLHLAGTGDHYFWRRRNLIAKPLLKESGIASILLENPFYGLRKPKDQIRSSLHNVSDIFIMGGGLILESIVIFNWCEQQGFGPIGLTGISMGGHMASLAATNWPKPTPLVPCLSWSTATPVFTEGVMSASIDWKLLENQYFSDDSYKNELAKMVKIIDEDDAFLAGQHFAQHYPASLKRLNKIQEETTDNNKEYNARIGNVLKNLMSKTNVAEYQHQMIEENEAAKMFPLNLLSSKFKTSDPSSIKDVCVLPVTKHPFLSGSKQHEQEALQFMRGIMDECTHLKNFEVPVDTELIISICAKNDAYVPRDNCMSLEKIWPGAEIRYINAGHVMGYLLHQKAFRSTITEAFERAMKKYPVNIS